MKGTVQCCACSEHSSPKSNYGGSTSASKKVHTSCFRRVSIDCSNCVPTPEHKHVCACCHTYFNRWCEPKELVFRWFSKRSTKREKLWYLKDKHCSARHLIATREFSVEEGGQLGGVCDRVCMLPCALQGVRSGLQMTCYVWHRFHVLSSQVYRLLEVWTL